jgi:hypothetical protein
MNPAALSGGRMNKVINGTVILAFCAPATLASRVNINR